MSAASSQPGPECASHHGPVGGTHAGHGHGHAHPPHPAPHTHSLGGAEGHRPRQRRALALALGLTVLMMVAELVGGVLTGSLMLLSDAIHMLSHAISLAVSWLHTTGG